jgi:DNA modification methylase
MPPNRQQEPSIRLTWEGRKPFSMPPQAPLRLHSLVGGQEEAQANLLIHGENSRVMAALLPDWEGRIDLIYADPPFLSGKRYHVRVGRQEDSRQPQTWERAEGYHDRWNSAADYLNMLHPRLVLMHRLLAPHGTLYLHLDWHAAAYGRLLLDEIFGPHRLLNEIIWVYHGPSPIRSAFKRKHDTILAYTKSKDYFFNADAVRVPYNASTVKTFKSSSKAGFGKVPNLKQGKVPEDWWYFPVVARLHSERTGYPTQKPEALLERIILASSQPGAVVADFFSGAGTALATAARLGRRWIGCDAHPLAIHTSYRRLLLQNPTSSFQLWKEDEFPQTEPCRPIVSLERQGQRITVTLKGVKEYPGEDFIAELDFWEVDWNYEGQVFRSMDCAVRPWREETLPMSLSRRAAVQGSKRVAVRVATRDGRWGLKVIPIPSQ